MKAVTTPKIEEFPSEVIQHVMMEMEADDLLSFIQTSKHIYGTFRDISSLIASTIARKKFGDYLLPIAVTRYQAQKLAPELRDIKQLAEFEKTVHDFVTRSMSLQVRTLMVDFKDFSLSMVRSMSSLHDCVMRHVERQVDIFTWYQERELASYPPALTAPDQEDQVLAAIADGAQYAFTPSEEAGLVKAFYGYEIASLVLYSNLTALEGSREFVFDRFWKQFAPWEYVRITLVMEELGHHVYDGLKKNHYERVAKGNLDSTDLQYPTRFPRELVYWDAAFRIVERYGLRRMEILFDGDPEKLDKARDFVMTIEGFEDDESWPRSRPWLPLNSSTTLPDVSEYMWSVHQTYTMDQGTSNHSWAFYLLSDCDVWDNGDHSQVTEDIDKLLGLCHLGGYAFRDDAKLEQFGLLFPTAEEMFRGLDVTQL